MQNLPRIDGAVEAVPFSRLAEEIIAMYAPPLRAVKTHAKMRQVVAIVDGLVGPDGTTDMLNPALIARFIESRPPETSRNTTLSLLRAFRVICTYAMQMGYIRISPFMLRKAWVRPERSRRPRQHLGRAEIARVLEKARAEVERKKRHRQAGPWAVWRCRRLHAVVSLVAYTGLRKMEALRLKVEDVDLAGGFIHVVERDGSALKTEASERSVPIAPPLAEVLSDWLPFVSSEWLFPNSTDSAPWTGGSPGWKPLDRLKALGRRAGVGDLSFLILRHSFATHGLHWGLTAEQIAQCMGHTTVKTQKLYQHEDLANLKGIADRIDFGPSGGQGS